MWFLCNLHCKRVTPVAHNSTEGSCVIVSEWSGSDINQFLRKLYKYQPFMRVIISLNTALLLALGTYMSLSMVYYLVEKLLRNGTEAPPGVQDLKLWLWLNP